jgi:hypothetical protein
MLVMTESYLINHFWHHLSCIVGTKLSPAQLFYSHILFRKKITHLTLERVFEENKSIDHKIENGDIVFSFPFDKTTQRMRVHILDNFEWEVYLAEATPTFTLFEISDYTPNNGMLQWMMFG